ncbi:hypothetical protein EDB86DRAFT_3064674 [Lactarius hatsudake]|nr:hypothetical protein EDB86DRAFT_3064674 [Lactarius hatsudake]
MICIRKKEHARFFPRRCILIKTIYEFYACGRSYEELNEQNISRNFWGKYIPETSFKFVVNGYNQSIPKAQQRQVTEDFSYMGSMGKVDLVGPEITMGCFEDIHGTTRQKHEGAAVFREALFDRLKLQYFGNTSIEAEISLLMANQTLVRYPGSPGKRPWRCGGLFDMIITDPPYGVRAGAKRLGRKRERASNSSVGYLMNPGGRLVFFLIDEYKELVLNSMLCDGMEVGRRLIAIRKSMSVAYPPPTIDSQAAHGASGSISDDHDGEDISPASPVPIPVHREFGEKYFQGFKTKKPSFEESGT